MIIYRITNQINGNVYIGQTTRSLKERWTEHCKPSSTNCPLIKQAINKYGKENFIMEVIDAADNIEELNKKEQYWISHYKENSVRVYNLSLGGIGNKTALTEERKEHLSRKITDKWKDLEYLSKMRSAWTEERRERLRKAMLGRKSSEETINKLRQFTGCRNSRHGVKLSDEIKQKISLSQKGKKRNQRVFVKPIICNETKITYPSIISCARAMGINHKGISKVLRNNRPQYKGFTFSYIK